MSQGTDVAPEVGKRAIMPSRLKIVHVEVGGTYGGSLGALETYLAFSDRKKYSHTVLLYYPTPGTARLASYADEVMTADLPLRRRFRGTSPGFRTVVENWALLGAARGAWRQVVRMGNYVRAFHEAAVLRRIVGLRKYDVVHVNNTFTYQLATFMALYNEKVPFVVHVRNPVVVTSEARRMASRSACAVTVARIYQRELEKWMSPCRVVTCYDGIQPPRPDAAQVGQLRRRFVVNGGWLVGSAGRLEKQKGYEYFIRAARRVVDRRNDVRFVLAGEGPLRSELEQMIRELGLESHFWLLGFRPDIANFLDALDVFVSPSLWEGLPITLVQALMLRKPVLATRVGGVPEVIPESCGANLVPPSDEKALAAGIVRAVENRDGVIASLEESYRLAGRLFDPAAQALAFDRLLEKFAR